ncbi:MAG: hypothetical protein Ta2G_15480 [Termitinemataceae bacterium]|nr:MAG: hypothetical protein Ta2G_15480 [Termitinemataceae bacterium]
MKNVCPKKEMLSIYHDDALPPQWKHAMEAHLASCPKCQQVLVSYKTVRDAICEPSLSDTAAAGERVLKKLNENNIADLQNEPRSERPGRQMRVRRLAKRRIAVPLPAAAAASAVLIITLSMLFLGKNQNDGTQIEVADGLIVQEAPIPTLPVDYDSQTYQDFAPRGNIQEVLKYLSENQDDDQEIVIIKLPEKKSFTRIGDPKMYNKMDFAVQPEQTTRKIK